MKTDNLTPAARIALLADVKRPVPLWPQVFVTVEPQNLVVVNDLISAEKQAAANQGRERLTYWIATTDAPGNFWEAPLHQPSVALAQLKE